MLNDVHSAYEAAITQAVRRARRSYFDQHVLTDEERGFIVIDEGDYASLPTHLIERIVFTMAGALSDDH